jgi:hypothetical protein
MVNVRSRYWTVVYTVQTSATLKHYKKIPVMRIRIRIHMFLGLPDPDPNPLFRGMDPHLDPDPSIIMQK